MVNFRTKKNILISIIVLTMIVFFVLNKKYNNNPDNSIALIGETKKSLNNSNLEIRSSLPKIPEKKILANDYHIFQTFNNCAPAALSMTLSYYGIKINQEKLAASLRPNNNLKGRDDDKSTPPEELAEKAKEYNLIPYYRANGNIMLIEQFIALDIPVIIRTLLYPDQDYAHYRVIKGYDQITGDIIQDDSFQGKDLRYSYDRFLGIWKDFNYAYLILVPPEKKSAVEKILGTETDQNISWQNAVKTAEEELKKNEKDIKARYNLSVALYYIGQYERAVSEFEEIEHLISEHKMWYQIEPIQAYFKLGNYDRVLELADGILNNNNKGFSELYDLKGESYLSLGKPDLAKIEFDKALYYNKKNYLAENAWSSPALSPADIFRGE